MRLLRPLADVSGSVAIEFVAVVPILLVVVAFMVDIGGAFYAQTQLQNAAQAGARYAQVNGWNSVGIANAVTSATDLASVSAAPAPRLACGCPQGTSLQLLAADCSTRVPPATACPDGSTPGRYVIVGARYTYSAPFSVASWPASVTYTANATSRLD